jgi:hypothetical protein
VSDGQQEPGQQALAAQAIADFHSIRLPVLRSAGVVADEAP